jgi:two-component system sensor histidine kinase RpfC
VQIKDQPQEFRKILHHCFKNFLTPAMFKSLINQKGPDLEQGIVRIAITVIVLGFFFFAFKVAGNSENKILALSATALYLVFGMGMVIVILRIQNPSTFMRTLGIIGDIGMVTFALMITGAIGAPLYGTYLWIIIGNGFRFGNKYLYLAQIASITGFAYATLTGNFWHQYPMLAVGLLIWLVVIPPYVSLLLKRLDIAINNAKKADSAKSKFLANMSHELRTPLNAIIGYSELLADETSEKGQRQYARDLKKIQHAGTHLLGLINEILDLSKIEQGRMEIFTEEINISKLLDEVKTTIEPLAEQNANQLQIQTSADVGCFSSDLTKLKQILYNLLSNACKFTHGGLIILDVAKITESRNGSIVFTIKDNGIGISPEKIEEIFQPFKQESSETTRNFGGTGLGLTISKHFCELLGGQLQLQSRKGEGSIFTVQLPDRLPLSPISPLTQ